MKYVRLSYFLIFQEDPRDSLFKNLHNWLQSFHKQNGSKSFKSLFLLWPTRLISQEFLKN